uniref:Uncharacterized protein n=1 Tax=Anguilla anguilla TaxID=7936 RepID=A0A0E9QFL3_ANGAN
MPISSPQLCLDGIES